MELSTEEVVKMIKAFQDSLTNLKKELTEQVEELKKHFYEDFIKPAEDNYAAWEHDTKLDGFRNKYKDLFDDELCAACRKAEGIDDLDVIGKVFDGYEETDKSIDEAEYVANVVSSLKQQLDLIKEETGAEKVSVEAKGDEVEVKADGETVATAETIDVPAEETEEEKEDEVESIEKPEEELDEEEEFVKELEKLKSAM